MSVLNSLKTSETETAILLLVPDSFLPHITAQLDDLKAKYFAGEPPFDNMADIVTLTTAAAQGAPDVPLGANVVELLQRAASVGVKMTDSQIRRMKELFGEARANFLFGPNWGEGAFKLAKYADPQTLIRQDGHWVMVNNTQFRRDMYDTIMGYQLPANPLDIPIGNEYQPQPPVVPVQVPAPYPGPATTNDHLLQQVLPQYAAVPQDANFYQPQQQFVPPQYNVTPQQFAQQYNAPPVIPQQYPGSLPPHMYQQKYEEFVRLSNTGKPLTNPQFGLIDRTIKMAGVRIFTGQKDGPLQEFLRLLSKTRRKEQPRGYQGKPEYEPNPDFDPGFFEYVNRTCGN